MKAIFTGTEQDLIDAGFEENTFGLYGLGDYIPEIWYEYHFTYRHKRYKVQTNKKFCFSNGTFKSLYLLKAGKHRLYKNCIDWYDCKNWKIFFKWIDKAKKKNDKPLIQDLIDKNLVRFEKE